ncbi:MAG TPA: DoxX family protein [Candidatus Limnocylindrales bacterium]|nr:DoxX family protein [Candidatus Limnocylindrales bacterium]
MSIAKVNPSASTQIPEPPLARFLFADTRMAWLWLIVRLYLGYEWLTAGWEKMTGTSINITSFGKSVGGAWVFGPNDGAAIAGFAKHAASLSTGAHPAVQSWYANFLTSFVVPNSTFFAYVVTFGEVLVGLGLIVGALTGIAAFFGIVMNLNYLLAGAVSTNPILGVLALFVILAWRIAGYYGVDRYLLPYLGTPWTGRLPVSTAPAGRQIPAHA